MDIPTLQGGNLMIKAIVGLQIVVYVLHLALAKSARHMHAQFINCCAFYEFTDCAAQFINCASSQIAPNMAIHTPITTRYLYGNHATPNKRNSYMNLAFRKAHVAFGA